jgi:FdhE protein
LATKQPREHQVVRGNSKQTKILDKLGEWAQREGSLPSVFQAYEGLLRLQMEARGRISIPPTELTKEAAFSQLGQGIPLLSFDDLLPSLDWPLIQDLFRNAAGILVEHTGQETAAAAVLDDFASDRSLLEQACDDWYQGRSLSSLAALKGVSEELLSATVQAVLYPFLIAHAEALGELVNHGVWRRKTCPICGGKPDFAFLDKERGGRWLLCSRCDTEWLFQRMQCPYCDSQNQKSLSYFSNDQGLYRLYTCSECRSYIKAIDLRNTNAEVLLPLERFLTAGIDRQALEAGYRAG